MAVPPTFCDFLDAARDTLVVNNLIPSAGRYSVWHNVSVRQHCKRDAKGLVQGKVKLTTELVLMEPSVISVMSNSRRRHETSDGNTEWGKDTFIFFAAVQRCAHAYSLKKINK